MHYHNFVLTIWQEGDALPNAPPQWRYSLANPHTGERIGFRSGAELGRFLHQWVALLPGDKPRENLYENPDLFQTSTEEASFFSQGEPE